MKLERKLLNLAMSQVKAAAGGTGVFEGWASTYLGIDSYNDTIMPGAYAESLKSGRPVAMYYNHIYRRPDMPAKIGTWTFEEKAEGLWAKGQLLVTHPLVKNLLPSLEAGLLDGLSIGYRVPEDGAKMNASGVRELHVIELHEVSIVDEPAQASALISLESIKSLHSIRDLETLLRDAGFSKSEAQATVAAARAILAKPEQKEEIVNPNADLLAALSTLYGKK